MVNFRWGVTYGENIKSRTTLNSITVIMWTWAIIVKNATKPMFKNLGDLKRAVYSCGHIHTSVDSPYRSIFTLVIAFIISVTSVSFNLPVVRERWRQLRLLFIMSSYAWRQLGLTWVLISSANILKWKHFIFNALLDEFIVLRIFSVNSK